MNRRALHLGLIVVAGALAYATSFAGVFLFDDLSSIVEDMRIRSLTDFWGSRPVVTLTLAINYRFGELEPFGYHLVNLTVHLLAAMTLYGLVRRTFARFSRLESTASWLAFVIAILWVVHPLQTQSVTYVVQRGESLMGLFYLLVLYCVLRGVAGPSARGWYAAAVIACALGMGCKAVMVTAPVAAFLFDGLVLSRSPMAAVRRRWGLYLALAATWGVLLPTGVIDNVFGTGGRRTVGFGTDDVTVLAFASTQPAVILHYLRLSFWPHPLCLDYMWPVARGAGVVVPSIVVAGLAGATLWMTIRHRAIGFVPAMFFIVLAPTSSIVPIKDLAFEHRMYLPLAAVLTLVVLAAHAILGRGGGKLQRAGFVLAMLLAVVFGSMTSARNRVYHDAATMWRDVAAQRPDNPRAHTKLGRIASESGDLPAAMEHYRQAIAVDPAYFAAHHSLGLLLAQTGRVPEAIGHLQETIRLEPEYFVAYNSLGNVLAALGRNDDAIALYGEAIRLEPEMPDPHNNLAIELVRQGRVSEAIPHFVEAIRLRPSYAEAMKNLAIVLDRTGDIDGAIGPYLDRAPLAVPHADAHVRAGERAALEGRHADAVAAFRRALAIDPEQPDAPRLLELSRRKQDTGN